MGPTPRKIATNGRSPLVNQQRQITSFFTKRPSDSPTPSPYPTTRAKNPNPNPKKQQRSPSPSRVTPSPVPPNQKKPLLVVRGGAFGDNVVGKRVRVYWPMDKAWYEGRVRRYDSGKGCHLVEYDDGEEEELDFAKERVEWVEEEEEKKPGRLKRLRKGCLGFSERVVEDVGVKDVAEEKCSSGSEDSSDESWGVNVGKVVSDDEDVELKLVGEEVEEEGGGKRGKKGRKDETRKRKASGGGKKLSSGKKSKCDEDADKDVGKATVVEPLKNKPTCLAASEPSFGLETTLMKDAPERFGGREALKFPFLGARRRDGKRRCPGDKDYDPRTLYLPPDFIKSLSSGQRQWWEFKSKHMDKVVFFKMGKFYELFEMDAHIGAKELDLQYMKGEQPHCGFPEKNFMMNVEKLAGKGYRILVVEQTETPEQLEMRRKEKGSKDKVVKREVCAVVTKGTLTEGELQSANPDASFIMAVAESFSSLEDQNFRRSVGVCLVDVATSRVILGQFEDDVECSSLCCLLSELRPVEIIKPAQLLSIETERALLRHARHPLVNELVPCSEFWDAEKTVCELKTFYNLLSKQAGSDSISLVEESIAVCLPDVLLELYDKGEDGSLALSALGGSLYYLKQAFLDETLLRFAKFELLPLCNLREVSQKPYMILDSAALENLEIFENSRNGDSSGTLYAQLNHCATAWGKRMLKTWLARPLYHTKSIINRQDAIAGLKGTSQSAALEFRKLVSGLPDMERLLARIFASSEANGRNANNVILYEDAAKKQLKEFISGLRGCELMDQACSSLSPISENVDSKLLHHLLTPGFGRPDIHSIINHFKGAFDWVEANETGRIVPHKGGDKEYDSACQKVKEIESDLLKHIKEQRRLLGDSSISYVTIGKDAYLLEIPDHLRGSIPQDYELQSSKKGCYRYWNPDIKMFLKELSLAESEKETALKSILQRLIRQFSEYHEKWRQLVSITAELDVLISLSTVSEFYEGPACRPTILNSLPSEVPCFSAKSLGHPLLRSDSLGKGSFVPNDVSIGGDDCSSFILLTGPNMGGKSTLLRQVCLTAILAQVGADVPAESFVLSPVDRIFVRMGAKDHIMTGQSTFLTELSETALMLSSATCNSLVALDELGRGTSTSDGQAIAESVLEHFVHRVHCRGMFSTHYHRLAVHYEKDPKVSLCHMACQVENEDGGIEEVTFLYRLTPGACPKSYGVNVARLAGLPSSLLQRAADKSGDFEAFYGKHRKGSEKVFASQRCSNNFADIVKNLIQIATDYGCGSSSGVSSIKSLVELQHRARHLCKLEVLSAIHNAGNFVPE